MPRISVYRATLLADAFYARVFFFFLLLTEITRSEEGSCWFARAHVLTAAVHDEVNGSRFLARGLCPAVDETSSGERRGS